MGKGRLNYESLPKDKKKKGFSVGPANLPDGVYKRKVIKIKETLIHKAKVRKQYSKTLSSAINPTFDPNALRAQKLFEEAEQERLLRHPKNAEVEPESEPEPPVVHPDRQAVVHRESTSEKTPTERCKRQPKTSSFKKEESFAAKVKKGREEAARQAEQRRRERDQKNREREMRKRTMSAKTRNGQVKLGKTSHMLLDKVMAQMGER